MSTASWRKSLSVIERLLENPNEFSLVQALRLLERSAVFEKSEKLKHDVNPSASDASQKETNQEKRAHHLSARRNASHPVGRFSPPSREVVRMTNSHSLGFPSTEISSIKRKQNTKNKTNEFKSNEDTQWQMMVNVIGLAGSTGVLPYHYTEMILKRLKMRDKTIAEFLNLFNHRTISLFYQSLNKYRLPIEYERSKLHKSQTDEESNHTKALLGLLGLGANNLHNRQSINDESLIFYSGLYAQQIKTPSGLRQIVKDYFDVPVEIEGFSGQWQELIDDVRTRLPSRYNKKGQNVCLGRSTMLGRHGWFAQGKFNMKLGPLNKIQFEKFAPGTGSLKSLNELVRSYVGFEQDYDCVIQVQREDVPRRIALNSTKPPLLSWNTWLSGKPKTNTKKDEILEIVMSSKRLD